ARGAGHLARLHADRRRHGDARRHHRRRHLREAQRQSTAARLSAARLSAARLWPAAQSATLLKQRPGAGAEARQSFCRLANYLRPAISDQLALLSNLSPFRGLSLSSDCDTVRAFSKSLLNRYQTIMVVRAIPPGMLSVA